MLLCGFSAHSRYATDFYLRRQSIFNSKVILYTDAQYNFDMKRNENIAEAAAVGVAVMTSIVALTLSGITMTQCVDTLARLCVNTTSLIPNETEQSEQADDSFVPATEYDSTVDACADTIGILNDIDELPDAEEAAAAIPSERRGSIVQTTYCDGIGDNYFYYRKGCIFNCTGYSSSEMAQTAAEPCELCIDIVSGQPQVLIMHTHTTESYDPYDAGIYDSDCPTRSTDREQNMVAVGEVLTEALIANGIEAVQACEYHDYPSYNNSYSRSRETVLQYLEKYPSIKVVIDLHRDGIEYADGTRVKPVALIDGKKAAQLMIICGADDGTMNMPNFRQNLKLAARLQNTVETMFPDLARPLLFDYRHYNQDLTTGSLLIEIGSHASTLEEAKYTASLLGKALAETLLNLD